jgi:hypothetical protein
MTLCEGYPTYPNSLISVFQMLYQPCSGKAIAIMQENDLGDIQRVEVGLQRPLLQKRQPILGGVVEIHRYILQFQQVEKVANGFIA